MDLFEVIRERRSIRKYQDRPVEPEKIAQIMEAARLAPSWKNMQCWKFLILTDEQKKQALLSAFPDDNPGKKALSQAPVIIVACADPKQSGIEEGQEYYMSDVAIAIEHILLSAHALGLGSCWMGLFSQATMKKALGIPEQFRIVGVTPLGYPDQEPKPRPRKELNEIVYAEKWGNAYGN